ncbi:unnamed protein product [Darwinula stevensoni]|uniref:Laminin N-terminal domain-containing protein n=1 Tax=Darwinula stevensoni TaxID=69355 RepID=A0A7R9A239_9CRUS|nr:unnamed protein product [Darwinula stevensoni]CAG0878726.1 unnamed protein product [Darwinula stevensoni]
MLPFSGRAALEEIRRQGLSHFGSPCLPHLGPQESQVRPHSHSLGDGRRWNITEEMPDLVRVLKLQLPPKMGNGGREMGKIRASEFARPRRIPGVEGIQLQVQKPCDKLSITSWEQRYCCLLPSDLRNFYLAHDGFELSWKWKPKQGEAFPLGLMKINSLSRLRRIRHNYYGQSEMTEGSVYHDSSLQQQISEMTGFSGRWKAYELDSCNGKGKVCLVYGQKGEDLKLPPPTEAQIWFMDVSYDWHYLASSFTHYFRMMLMNLGLPYWQYSYTSVGQPVQAQFFAAFLLGFLRTRVLVSGQPLTPPYFNLAEGRRVTATATCGEGVNEPELYCKLVGASVEKGDVNINLIQGQVCDYCDPSNGTLLHSPEYAVDGTERWWQSPPLSRGPKYNEVNLTIDLGQVSFPIDTVVPSDRRPR